MERCVVFFLALSIACMAVMIEAGFFDENESINFGVSPHQSADRDEMLDAEVMAPLGRLYFIVGNEAVKYKRKHQRRNRKRNEDGWDEIGSEEVESNWDYFRLKMQRRLERNRKKMEKKAEDNDLKKLKNEDTNDG